MNYIGILLIVCAYATMWFFVVKTKSIVESISRKNLSSLREIQQELKI